jgi:hypothetical protein
MLNFTLSWVPLIALTVANFFLSWIYYSPAAPWFKAWLRGIGKDPESFGASEEERKGMLALMVGGLVSSFLLPLGLQVLVRSVGAESFAAGALVGAVAWAAFAVTQALNARFEGRKASVLVINGALYLATYVVYGGVIAVWR